MEDRNLVELLAPAGSREALTAAIESGANAVYLAGNMFGARAYADNFDEDGLREAIRTAHLRNVLINVTVNTIIDDQELPALEKYLRFLYEAGADAILVQDLGVARLAREVVPELPLHASTQMTVHNLDGVLALQELGFSRVVLSREVSLENIRHIIDNCNVEIEVFVHGALCVCYSGQCLMSSLIGGRSGNRGRCAQPCRLPYTLVDGEDNNLLGDTAGKYLLSPRDMNTIELLPQLIEAGVASLKIEGRMKRPEYVAIVVNNYRQAIDSYYDGAFQVTEKNRHDLSQIFNRDFTTAYLEKKQGRNMMSDKRPNNRGIMLGRVLEYDRSSGEAILKLADRLSEGDQVDFWVKVGGRVTATVRELKLIKEGKNRNVVPVKCAEAGNMVCFPVDSPVYAHDRAFKVYDQELMDWAKGFYNTGAPVRRVPVDIEVTAAVGEPLVITITDADGNKGNGTTAFIGQEAIKRPLNEDTIKKQVSRLGTSIFELRGLTCRLGDNVMVPISEINEARRAAVENVEKMRLEAFSRKGRVLSVPPKAKKISAGKAPTGITAVVDRLEMVQTALSAGADWIVYGGDSYAHEAITPIQYEKAAYMAHKAGASIAFNTSRIIRDQELPAFHKWLRTVADYGPDAINVHNIGSLSAVKKYTSLPVHTDYSFIVYNHKTLEYLEELGVEAATLSPELNMGQIGELLGESPIPLSCIVDGNLELMVSEYCVTGSFIGGLHTGSCSAPCVNSGKQFFLKDRKDVKFPLVMDQHCHMHVLNGNRLSMLPHAMKLREMGISQLRIEGRYMNNGQLKKTIENYRRYMKYDRDLTEAEKTAATAAEGPGITRGHYFRGVL
nr:U32 family peptidase [Anaerovibrio sp.]